jgi:hypothetical protein
MKFTHTSVFFFLIFLFISFFDLPSFLFSSSFFHPKQRERERERDSEVERGIVRERVTERETLEKS